MIKSQNMAIGYNKQVTVSDLTLTVGPGQTLALVGANGSGKSTLLKTFAGLLPLVGGSLQVFGKGPGTSPQRVAYLSQSPASAFLLPIRAIDVVWMSRFSKAGLLSRLKREDEDLVREAMEFMGVADLSNQALNTLSGGQRQRVFLAHVLARQADLVLLDEPTSNLDPHGQALYQKAVERMVGSGAAVVFATHNIKEAAESDQALLLAERVVAYGPGREVLTPDSLLATFGLIAKLEEGRVVVVEKDHGHEH